MTLDQRAAAVAARWGIAGARAGDACCVTCSGWGWFALHAQLGLIRAAEACFAGAALRCALLRCETRDTGAALAGWCSILVLRAWGGAFSGELVCCWFVAGVLQAAGEENKFWKIRDFVNSKKKFCFLNSDFFDFFINK